MGEFAFRNEEDAGTGALLPFRMATVNELATILHVHTNTVRHWTDEGHLKSYRIGPRGDRRFKWEDVNRFINGSNDIKASDKSYHTRVLIVDDDPQVRYVMKDIVEQHGAKATTVHSGEEALEELKRAHFDLIFLDLLLPGIDGVEVLRRIKANGTNAVVAIITGYGDGPLAVEAVKLGPLIFLRKPLRTQDIIGTIDLAESARRYLGFPHQGDHSLPRAGA